MSCEKLINDINDANNLAIIGYTKVFCHPDNHEKLSKLYPCITFTLSRYVEENKIYLFNHDKFIGNTIKPVLNPEICFRNGAIG